MKSKKLKEEAISLRKAGYSYSYILQSIKVSKSTLSYWLSDVAYKPNKETIERMNNSRLAAILSKNRIKLQSITNAQEQALKDIGIVSERDLFMLGIGLYLGEGTKSHNQVRIINADPKIIKLAIKWFTEVCKIPRKNLLIRLHLYPDNSIQESLEFWSKAVAIPLKQFQTSYVDIRNNKKSIKYGKLPYGTAHLKVISAGNKDFGVLLSRKIMAWIGEVLK